jgi:pimeloyl-ACP methyl ester carboxylesterase
VNPSYLRLVLVMIVVLSLTACASTPQPAAPAPVPTATPVPPTPVPPTAAPTEAAVAATQATPLPMPTPTITDHVKLGDITMYYASYGSGKPLILLHGGLGSADNFEKQVPAFAQQYRVITPDSRGQGRTTDSDAPLSYHLMAEDVVRLMDTLKIDKADIVGWSDGGNTGLDLAINHPERVAALVTYGANATPDGLEAGFISYLKNASDEMLQRDLGGEYLALSSTPEHLPVIVRKVVDMFLTQPNFTPQQLASITPPTAIVEGMWEQFISTKHVEAIAKAIPNAELIWIPKADHYAPIKIPDEFNKVVLDFLKNK